MRNKIYEGDKPYVFVSYAHKDADVVLPAIESLQNNGFRVWFDRGIEAGTEWPEYIAEHLEKADSVIVFMSEAAAESRNCRREINFAIDIGKEPLVIYIEDVKLSAGMKLQLNTLQALFMYRSKNFEEFIQELCKARLIENCRETIAMPNDEAPAVNASPVVDATPVVDAAPVIEAIPVVDAAPVVDASPVTASYAVNNQQSVQKATPTTTGSKTPISLVLGILGIIFAWLYALFGHLFSIVGIVIGAKEYKTTKKSTGLVLSVIGEVCAVISSIIGAAMASGYY